MKKFIMTENSLKSMLDSELLRYTPKPGGNDNGPNTFEKATALFLLELHEFETKDGTTLSRINEHFASATAAGRAPSFDAVCLWNYCPFSASIAIAKATPSIWNSIPEEIHQRLTFIMEMYAYLESFATSDFNSYRTGPGLSGNFHKDWNPNYRLANVPVMVFVTHFFGDGDMDKGCKIVNDMLHGFNEEVYDRLLATMDAYGWDRAKAIWTTPARQHADGTYGTDARHVLLYGGTTYTSKYAHTEVIKESGDGLGVTNGGNDYLYKGFPLSCPEGIVEHLLTFNYSGGPVKSDHHYDVDKDGIAERVAWIMDESTSPYQGQIGMMKEFASGNRSSTGYCSHDFMLCNILIAATKTLGIYDVTTNPELWSMVKVGNGDFIYKNEKGYQCFATGSYGTSAKPRTEDSESTAYFAMKDLWYSAMLD